MSRWSHLCPGCFKPKENGACLLCGYAEVGARNSTLLPYRTEVAGRYVLGRDLATGPSAITYLALEIQTSHRLAIKEYFPAALASRGGDAFEVVANADGRSDFDLGLEHFLEAARTLQSTPHPSLPSVVDHFSARRTGYLVMKYFEGETLASLLARTSDNYLPRLRVFSIMDEVLNALEVLHGQGILHRNVNPANIFVPRQGQPVLLGFGSARLTRNIPYRPLLTPGYSPPEMQDDGAQGAWSDVYSCGATIYAAMTGFAPPAAADRKVAENLHPPHTLDQTIPEHISAAIVKALAISPQDRPRSVAAFRTALGDGGAARHQATPVVPPDRIKATVSTAAQVMKKLLSWIPGLALIGVALWLCANLYAPFFKSPRTIMSAAVEQPIPTMDLYLLRDGSGSPDDSAYQQLEDQLVSTLRQGVDRVAYARFGSFVTGGIKMGMGVPSFDLKIVERLRNAKLSKTLQRSTKFDLLFRTIGTTKLGMARDDKESQRLDVAVIISDGVPDPHGLNLSCPGDGGVPAEEFIPPEVKAELLALLATSVHVVLVLTGYRDTITCAADIENRWKAALKGVSSETTKLFTIVPYAAGPGAEDFLIATMKHLNRAPCISISPERPELPDEQRAALDRGETFSTTFKFVGHLRKTRLNLGDAELVPEDAKDASPGPRLNVLTTGSGDPQEPRYTPVVELGDGRDYSAVLFFKPREWSRIGFLPQESAKYFIRIVADRNQTCADPPLLAANPTHFVLSKQGVLKRLPAFARSMLLFMGVFCVLLVATVRFDGLEPKNAFLKTVFEEPYRIWQVCIAILFFAPIGIGVMTLNRNWAIMVMGIVGLSVWISAVAIRMKGNTHGPPVKLKEAWPIPIEALLYPLLLFVYENLR